MPWDNWQHMYHLSNKVRNYVLRGYLKRTYNDGKLLKGRLINGFERENDQLDIIHPVGFSAHVKADDKCEVFTVDLGGESSRRVIWPVIGDREKHPQPDEGESYIYAPDKPDMYTRIKKGNGGGGGGGGGRGPPGPPGDGVTAFSESNDGQTLERHSPGHHSDGTDQQMTNTTDKQHTFTNMAHKQDSQIYHFKGIVQVDGQIRLKGQAFKTPGPMWVPLPSLQPLGGGSGRSSRSVAAATGRAYARDDNPFFNRPTPAEPDPWQPNYNGTDADGELIDDLAYINRDAGWDPELPPLEEFDYNDPEMKMWGMKVDKKGQVEFTNNTTFGPNDTATFKGTTNIEGPLNVTGDTNINAKLDVVGPTNITGPTSITGALDIAGALNVTGPANYHVSITAPTMPPGDSSINVATTEFVTTAIAPILNALQELADSLGTDIAEVADRLRQLLERIEILPDRLKIVGGAETGTLQVTGRLYVDTPTPPD